MSPRPSWPTLSSSCYTPHPCWLGSRRWAVGTHAASLHNSHQLAASHVISFVAVKQVANSQRVVGAYACTVSRALAPAFVLHMQPCNRLHHVLGWCHHCDLMLPVHAWQAALAVGMIMHCYYTCAQGSRDFHRARSEFVSVTEDLYERIAAAGPPADDDYSMAACLMRIQVGRGILQTVGPAFSQRVLSSCFVCTAPAMHCSFESSIQSAYRTTQPGWNGGQSCTIENW
jgi:hypothetical protein